MTVNGNYRTADHTYNSPGSYTVTLTVTDNAGATGSESRTVAIDLPNAPPSAGFTFTCSGASCSFDGGTSADSDGAIQTYSWSFGDGTTGAGPTFQHVYAQAGSYTVTLSVTDDVGRFQLLLEDRSASSASPRRVLR